MGLFDQVPSEIILDALDLNHRYSIPKFMFVESLVGLPKLSGWPNAFCQSIIVAGMLIQPTDLAVWTNALNYEFSFGVWVDPILGSTTYTL